MSRLRYDGLTSTLGGDGLDAAETTITFAAALTHAAGDVATLTEGDYIPLSVCDADGTVTEIVHLTAYISGATTGTIRRGEEGTTAAAHDSGVSIVHGPTRGDFRPHAWAIGTGTPTPPPTPPVRLDAAAVNIAPEWTTLATGGGHNAFPGITLTNDGRLLVSYRAGSEHISIDGTAHLVESHQMGRPDTWGNDRIVVDDATYDVRDPMLSNIDGRVWLSYFLFDVAADAGVGIYVKHSDDSGDTWSTAVEVATGPDVRLSAPVAKLPDGSLGLPYYSLEGAETNYSCRFARLDDDGATWTTVTAIDSAANGGTDWTEWVVRNVDDTLVGLVRNNDTNEISRITSADSGLTWTSPITQFDGSGRPEWLNLSTGLTLAVYRGTTATAAGYVTAISTHTADGSTGWAAEQLIKETAFQMTYAALVEVAPGVAAMVWSEEGSTQEASGLHFRYLTDGDTLTPLSPSLATKAQAIHGLAVLDTFQRADSTGLGQADTGQLWRDDIGTLKVNDGFAEGTTTSAIEAASTVDAGIGHYVIDSLICWEGTDAGTGILFRYVDNNNFLYATIETSGDFLRLKKKDAGTVTTLVEVATGGLTGSASPIVVWYGLRISLKNMRIKVFLDGEKLIDHTLTGGDETTYPSSATRCGLRLTRTGTRVAKFLVSP